MIAAQIAYERGTNATSVWVAKADGSGARKLGAGFDPLISPNGRLVAVTTGSRLELIPVGRGRPRVVAAGGNAYPLAWSPDSRYLAVSDNGLAVVSASRGRARTLVRGALYGAGFAPDRSDRIVYAIAASQSLTARVDLHLIKPSGAGQRRLTTDGRSLYPVWGRQGIAFDRERLRGASAYPEYQVWLMRGTRVSRLTHLRVPSLQEGLVPLEFSARGGRMLAEFEGEDTSYAYTIQLKPLQVRQVKLAGQQVQGAAISRDGRSLLVSQGGFENPPDKGQVEEVPFGGGAARVLTIGASPSWTL